MKKAMRRRAKMVKIKASMWLRPKDVNNGEIITIVDEGKSKSADETPFGREVFEIGVRLPSGEKKIWSMNRTTQRRCIEAWGNETKNWIGKRLRIELKEQNVKGVMKKVIYGFPIADKVTEVPADMSAAKEEEITVTLTVREAIQLMALLSKIKAQLENDVQTTNAVHLCA